MACGDRRHRGRIRLSDGAEIFPAVGLVVSGGHTNLYDCRSPVEYELLGSTRDDAAGEAFDKGAAILGLAYPGGPSIERAARQGQAGTISLPRALLKPESLDFSFSGLKTALLYLVKGRPGATAAVQPLTYLQLVLGALIGATVFDEQLTLNMLIGSVMVVGAGIFTIWRESVVARRKAGMPDKP